MTRLDRVNLGQIERAYLSKGAPALKARKLLARKGAKKGYMRWLLRHHCEEAIADDETWLRDQIDYLIAFYSMVEVGCMAGFVPPRLPRGHRERARAELGNPAMRTYYEDHYPLMLPRLHLKRCTLPASRQSTPAITSSPPFEEFFALTRPIEGDGPVETFLWFLDGGWRGGFDIDDTIMTIAKPKAFFRCISVPPEDADDLALSIQGFTIFLAFCRELKGLLNRVADWPLVQSAMWHYHGYWFDLMRDRFGAQMRTALAQFDQWEARTKRPGRTDRLILREAREEREDLERAVAVLTSGRYGWRLREAAILV